jgi:hypothetical protein
MKNELPLIFKFRKDYISLIGGIKMYECTICKKGCPTYHSLVGHLFDKHKLGIRESELLAGGH